MILRSNVLLLGLLVPPTALLLAVGVAPQNKNKQQKKQTRTGTKTVSAPASAAATEAAFTKEVAPLIKKYCVACHMGKSAQAGIDLTIYPNVAAVVKGRDNWDKVAKNVGANSMPPEGMPHPTQAERDKIVAWVESTLSKADCNIKDPGRITLRRLNREEYNNTVRDLVGLDFRPGKDFPNDDVGYGFDNIGDVLSISPLLMEKYLTAAEKIANDAIIVYDRGAMHEHLGVDRLRISTGAGAPSNTGIMLYTNGEVYTTYQFNKPGDYLIRVKAYGEQAGPDPARMAFRIGDKENLKELSTVDVKAVEGQPQVYDQRITVKGGRLRIAAAFTNDYYNANDPNPKNRDRNLVIEDVEIVGPLSGAQVLPISHKLIITSTPKDDSPKAREECARKIMGDFARKAYRRPVTTQEVDRLVRIVNLATQEGESFERGIQLAVQAVLVSPHFLFRVEVDPNPNDAKASRLLTDYELATRLSYFLWSSMPDEELMAQAAKGKLQDSKVLSAEIDRMLKDPKARALAENFGGQWLQLRSLANVAPNPEQFPDFNEAMRSAMRTETEMFFDAIVREDRSVLDFLDAKYTFLNEPLAKHYGITGVSGNEFRRVALTGTERGGILTQASILTVTSNPTRTSPVKRGKWVMEQILGTPPPPPPPNVPELEKGQLTGTLRQRMEQHRKNPACASCHARMDPLGFGLENYDATGGWRTNDGKFAVDSSGVLPGNVKFNGPSQLKTILMTKKGQFVHTLTEKLMTFALGRGLEYFDRCAVDTIAKNAATNGYKFSTLVKGIVLSDPFRKRRGDGGSNG